MIKRYSAYVGSNVSMDQISQENPEGNWIKFDDLKVFLGLREFSDPILTDINTPIKEALMKLSRSHANLIVGDQTFVASDVRRLLNELG